MASSSRISIVSRSTTDSACIFGAAPSRSSTTRTAFRRCLTDFDLYLHGEGTHYESYNTLGAHIVESLGVTGVRFAVWAPNAEVVTVVGEFNHWDTRRHPMRLRNGGIWEIFIPELGAGMPYKYYVRSRHLGHRQLKADPYGFACEVPPKSASVVADLTNVRMERPRVDGAARADELAEASRSRSTKFISNPGCASLTARACRIARWPSPW